MLTCVDPAWIKHTRVSIPTNAFLTDFSNEVFPRVFPLAAGEDVDWPVRLAVETAADAPERGGRETVRIHAAAHHICGNLYRNRKRSKMNESLGDDRFCLQQRAEWGNKLRVEPTSEIRVSHVATVRW